MSHAEDTHDNLDAWQKKYDALLARVAKLEDMLDRSPNGEHAFGDCLLDSDINFDKGCKGCAWSREVDAVCKGG